MTTQLCIFVCRDVLSLVEGLKSSYCEKVKNFEKISYFLKYYLALPKQSEIYFQILVAFSQYLKFNGRSEFSTHRRTILWRCDEKKLEGLGLKLNYLNSFLAQFASQIKSKS